MNIPINTNKILTITTFIGMVVVNVLANTLPINNTTTGDISNAYPNLFAPAPVTFSIWGLIYVLLAIYTLYQSGLFSKKIDSSIEKLLHRVNIFYIVSSIANMLWIISWHHRLIGISVILILIILYCLIKISEFTGGEKLPPTLRLIIRVPFTIYFGWITVATIANITTFLVSISWNGFGLSDQFWTVVILAAGAIIGITRMLRDNSRVYGLVIVWAYLGILLKHTSVFGSEYPSIITAILVCLTALFITEAKLFLSHKN